jgi:hypothetical protein
MIRRTRQADTKSTARETWHNIRSLLWRDCTLFLHKLNAPHSEGPYRQYKSPTSLKQYLWNALSEDKHKEVSVQTISVCLNTVCLTLNNSALRWHSNHFHTFWGSSINGESTFILLVIYCAFLPRKNFIYLIIFKNSSPYHSAKMLCLHFKEHSFDDD